MRFTWDANKRIRFSKGHTTNRSNELNATTENNKDTYLIHQRNNVPGENNRASLIETDITMKIKENVQERSQIF